MKYVQHVRKEWCLRITVPAELRGILGCRELVERHLPQDTRTRERVVLPMIERFLTQIDDARASLVAAKSADTPTLSMAAKNHYAKTLLADEMKRAALPDAKALKSEQDSIKSRINTGEITT